MEFLTIETGDYRTNTYIIAEGGKAILIDPGDDIALILQTLERIGAEPAYILITHGHFDHIRAVSRLQNDGALVYMSAIDYELLKQAEFYQYDESETVEPFEVNTPLNDLDKLELLGHSIKVIATPGHTPGGVCYIFDGDKIFTGDTLFKLSVGRWDFPKGNGAELVKSLRRLFSIPGDMTVYPGHGEKTTLEYERKFNPYAKI